MALNASGPISIGGSTAGQSINLELSRSASAASNLNESALRALANKASGSISLSDFYSKTQTTQWRINVLSTRTVDAFSVFISEIEMRSLSGGANLCSGGTATALSTSAGFLAPAAFDNSNATGWSTASGVGLPIWIQYTFTSAVPINEITIRAGDTAARANRAPRTFYVEYYNGSTWVNKYTSSDQAAWGISELRTFLL